MSGFQRILCLKGNELSPDTTVEFNFHAVFFCLKETLAPFPPRGHGQAVPHQDTLRGVQHLQPGRCSPARPEEVPCVPGSQGSCGHPAAGTGQDLFCVALQASSEEQRWPPLALETIFQLWINLTVIWNWIQEFIRNGFSHQFTGQRSQASPVLILRSHERFSVWMRNFCLCSGGSLLPSVLW